MMVVPVLISCGLNCKKIEKECKKKYKLPITYLEHSKNLGVLEARRHAVEQAVGKYIYNGVLENRDIFHGYLVEENHCGYLCGKLISRDVYLEAFNHIPYMFCVMADDVIQYF